MRLRDQPRTIWVLALGGAISSAGTAMVIPLLTLFLTGQHGMSLSAASVLLGVFFVAGTMGNLIGGSAADVLGRRPVILISLGGAALSSAGIGFSDRLPMLIAALILFGLFSSAFGPAGRALVADIVPAAHRAESFALLRVAYNVGFAIGPALAGAILALGRDPSGVIGPGAFRPLFVVDAVTSAVFAIVVLATVPETLAARALQPDVTEEQPPAGKGSYREVFADRRFISYVGVWILVVMLYVQLFSTAGPYLNSTQAIPVERFAALLSINAAMVVVGQVWVTRRAGSLGSWRALAAGVVFHGLGLLALLVSTTAALLAGAIAIFTVGEMLMAPVGDAVATAFAGEHNRGRYLGVYALAGAIGFALGPVIGGVLVDSGHGDWLWVGAFVVSIGTALVFLRLRGAEEAPAV